LQQLWPVPAHPSETQVQCSQRHQEKPKSVNPTLLFPLTLPHDGRLSIATRQGEAVGGFYFLRSLTFYCNAPRRERRCRDRFLKTTPHHHKSVRPHTQQWCAAVNQLKRASESSCLHAKARRAMMCSSRSSIRTSISILGPSSSVFRDICLLCRRSLLPSPAMVWLSPTAAHVRRGGSSQKHNGVVYDMLRLNCVKLRRHSFFLGNVLLPTLQSTALEHRFDALRLLVPDGTSSAGQEHISTQKAR